MVLANTQLVGSEIKILIQSLGSLKKNLISQKKQVYCNLGHEFEENKVAEAPEADMYGYQQ